MGRIKLNSNKKRKLNKKNWELTREVNDWLIYDHKVRRKVRLQLDKRTMLGVFWDRKKKRVISGKIKIEW